jgi:hypothetical protein
MKALAVGLALPLTSFSVTSNASGLPVSGVTWVGYWPEVAVPDVAPDWAVAAQPLTGLLKVTT